MQPLSRSPTLRQWIERHPLPPLRPPAVHVSPAFGSAGIVRRSRCAREISMNSTVLSESKLSVYEAVTAQIIAAIEAGASVSRMPWQSGIVQLAMPVNAATEMPYQGVNVVALW